VINRDDSGLILSHYALTVFAGHMVGGLLQPGSDAARVTWAEPTRLAQLPLLPGTRDAIDKALAA
jgi:hypothetical protein